MKKLYILSILLCLSSSFAYSQVVKPDVILSPNGPNTSVYWNVKFKTIILPHFNKSAPPIYQDTVGALFLNTDTTDKHIYIRYKMGTGGIIALANLKDVSVGLDTNAVKLLINKHDTLTADRNVKNNGFIYKIDSIQVLNPPVNGNNVLRLADSAKIKSFANNVFNFSNGLTNDGSGDITLGGTLTTPTNITVGGFNIFEIASATTGSLFSITDGGAYLLSSTGSGFQGSLSIDGYNTQLALSGKATILMQTVSKPLLISVNSGVGASYGGDYSTSLRSQPNGLASVKTVVLIADSVKGTISGGSGTVTSIATSTGILGGTITSSGTLKADTSVLQTILNFFPKGDTRYYKASNPSGYISANQSISFAPTGDVTGTTSGTTSLAPVLSIGAGRVTNTMLAGSIAASKLIGTDITTIGTLVSGSIPYSLVTGGPTAVSGANPAATIGLTAVNGSAGTFMRSDAAPALSQSISPTMTALWTFQQNNIATTPTDAVYLQNNQASTSGATRQISPSQHFGARVWNTSGTPADNWADWITYADVTSGSTPTTTLTWKASKTTTSTPSYGGALLTLDNNGNLNITGNLNMAGGGNILQQGGLNSSGSNIFIPTTIAGSPALNGQYLFGNPTSSTVILRTAFNGTGGASTVANGNAANVVFAGGTGFNTGSSGTNKFIVNVAVNGFAVATSGTGTANTAASLYIDAAPTGVATNNYPLYINAGNSFFGGNILSTGSINLSNAQTTVSGSTSGSAIFSQTHQGSSLKHVLIYCNALVGTATYSFPTSFTNTPVIDNTSGPSSSVVTSLSTSSVTVTGATTTGYIIIEGY